MAAHAFLRGGLAMGERVCLAGSERDIEAWLTDGRVARAVADGAAIANVVDQTRRSFDLVTQLDLCRAATEVALADGYSGFRVAADVTAVVREPTNLAEFVRYEQLVDRYMAAEPFSAMCAFRRADLPSTALARLASVHPAGNSGAPFRIFANPDGGTAIAGDLDMTTSDLLCAALAGVEPLIVRGELVLDATRLAFIDHRSLLVLARFAATRGTTLVLRTRKPHLSRLIDLLELRHVRVEGE
ncbi:MEDS domain-containing protein [Luedemannella helvata]|uniref:MEDS domain-containing protein n=1 Tax=Luedemannella helvata TaxID=349315 RepID=A0ABN2KHI3_9ACTN